MMEEEWENSRDIGALIEVLGACVHDRKLRLFAVACCRRIQDLIVDSDAQRLLDTVELHADRPLAIGELRAVEERLDDDLCWPNNAVIFAAAVDCATRQDSATSYFHAVDAAVEAVLARTRMSPYTPEWLSEDHRRRETIAQIFLIRDIIGNPFRPVAFDPAWRTSTAVALAKQMYDSRDFAIMPILGDALQDAGCDNDDILTHCRDPQGMHVRGCWVVDLVLGKS